MKISAGTIIDLNHLEAEGNQAAFFEYLTKKTSQKLGIDIASKMHLQLRPPTDKEIQIASKGKRCWEVREFEQVMSVNVLSSEDVQRFLDICDRMEFVGLREDANEMRYMLLHKEPSDYA